MIAKQRQVTRGRAVPLCQEITVASEENNSTGFLLGRFIAECGPRLAVVTGGNKIVYMTVRCHDRPMILINTIIVT